MFYFMFKFERSLLLTNDGLNESLQYPTALKRVCGF